ncbi:condensation domain-containing protein [Chromobacterium haemolyticum]|nr:condensation domain-containing protein [Chromobacterium haemolyticum]
MLADGVNKAEQWLSPAQIAAWQASAKQHGVDWGAWLLSAVGAWLTKHSGRRALTLGLPVMNRLGTPALAVPCMAMNIAPLSLRLDEDLSAADLSRQLADSLRAIRPHQRYRYEQLRGDLARVGGLQRLFGAVVNLMPFDRRAPFAGLDSRVLPLLRPGGGRVDQFQPVEHRMAAVPGSQPQRLPAGGAGRLAR